MLPDLLGANPFSTHLIEKISQFYILKRLDSMPVIHEARFPPWERSTGSLPKQRLVIEPSDSLVFKKIPTLQTQEVGQFATICLRPKFYPQAVGRERMGGGEGGRCGRLDRVILHYLHNWHLLKAPGTFGIFLVLKMMADRQGNKTVNCNTELFVWRSLKICFVMISQMNFFKRVIINFKPSILELLMVNWWLLMLPKLVPKWFWSKVMTMTFTIYNCHSLSW